MKHGETLAKAQQIVDSGPALSTVDLALHLNLSYSGARRVAESLVKQGKIVRDKSAHGMVMYRAKWRTPPVVLKSNLSLDARLKAFWNGNRN